MLYTVTLNPAVDRELVVPKLEINQVLRSIVHRVDFGGKGINVSRGLAALGQGSVVLGFIGGKTGDMLDEGLEKLEIDRKFVRVQDETRTNISIVSEDRTQIIKVNEPGPFISSEALDTLLQLIYTLAQPDDWWILSGSLPPGTPPTIYAHIIEAVKSAGGKTILDTSEVALIEGCKACPYLVKSNLLEANQLTRGKARSIHDVQAALDEIHANGIEIFAVTLGAEGAIISKGENTWIAEPPCVEEKNPAGAGDAFVAGLVYRLYHGNSLHESLKFGVACGTASASLPGTAMPELSQVERLLPHVVVRQLD